jgi:hypothetical protein
MDLTTPPGIKLTTPDSRASKSEDFGDRADRARPLRRRHVGCVDP